MLFDRFGTPKGGVVTNYLLEKSRTVKPGQGERNFHVFYQLVQGAPRDERARLCLLDSADAYPSLASCTSVQGIDDSKEFNDTAKAMADVGALAASRRVVVVGPRRCSAQVSMTRPPTYL